MRFTLKLIATTLILWFAGAVYYIWYTRSNKTNDFSQTQAVVVYAGGRTRISVGISLLKAGYAPILFIAGIENSHQLNNYLVETGVKPERVIYGSSNTKISNNAAEIAEFISGHSLTSIRLVAFSYQMPRVLEEVSMLIPNSVRILTYPIITDSTEYVASFKEYNKYLVAELLKYAR